MSRSSPAQAEARGIAAALGEEGATVYVTGRGVRRKPNHARTAGTIDDTAEEVSARRGAGIAVSCDHTDDAQVKRMEVLERRLRLPE